MKSLSLKREKFEDEGYLPDENGMMVINHRPHIFSPSEEQADIMCEVESARRSILINAGAGTGKTTTLVELMRKMRGYVSVAMYNKKNVRDFNSKMEERGVNCNARVGTFHSFGYGYWRRTAPQVKLDGKGDGQAGYYKSTRVFDVMTNDGISVPYSYRPVVSRLVSLAKQHAFCIDTLADEEDWMELINRFDLQSDLCDLSGEFLDGGQNNMVGKLLEFSSTALSYHRDLSMEVIDFDDMPYMPLFRRCNAFQVDWLLVDECQDFNLSRILLARKMLKRNGILVSVGDRRQAIYGFTGADSRAIDKVAEMFGCHQMPLSISYRCPRLVVEHASPFMPELRAHENAADGVVGEMTEKQFLAYEFRSTDAILCRKNAPLVALAYGFIRRGIACKMEGRDIGEGLVSLVDKWKVGKLDTLVDRLEKYKDKNVLRLRTLGKAMQAEALADRVETLQALIDGMPKGATVADVRARITSLFQDSDGNRIQCLTLSTVHKSKGLEWPRVFLYGRNLWMPSKFATQDWQMEQENNLLGVAITRSMGEFYEVRVPKR